MLRDYIRALQTTVRYTEVAIAVAIDSSTPVISSSEFSTMRLEECDMDSISTLRPCEIGR